MELGLELGLDLGTASAQARFSSSSPVVLTLFLSETMCFGLQDNPWLQSDASAEIYSELRDQLEWCRGYFQDLLRPFFESPHAGTLKYICLLGNLEKTHKYL